MFPHFPSATIIHFIKTLSRRIPRTLCVLLLIALATVCFSDRVRRLIPGSHAAQEAIRFTVQDSPQEREPVLLGRDWRRLPPARGRAGNPAALRERSLQPAVIAPSISTAREQHTATQLLNGRLLVVGGRNASSTLATAQLFDPTTGAWTNTGSLGTARYAHVAVLLQSGRVLVVGGRNAGGGYLASAELYDPSNGTWTPTGSLATARSRATASLLPPTSSTLPNGKVLVTAGEGAGGTSLRTAELYDPINGSWSAAGSLTSARREHTATLLGNGRVLAVGGLNGNTSLRTVEMYSPISNTWSSAGMLRTERSRHTATVLVDGRVLVAGGENAGAPLASAELYNPTNNIWTFTGSLSQARRSHSATLLPHGRVLVAGGFGASALGGYQLYDPAANTWGNAGNLINARANHTATLLADGATLLVGGGLENGSTFLSSVESLEFNSPAWTAGGTFNTARELNSVMLLSNGKVLVAGGFDGETLGDSQLYDPLSNSWSRTGNLNATRYQHNATLLPSGRVLLTGGIRLTATGDIALSTADIYDPNTGNWLFTGSMLASRVLHTTTLLADGRVLVAGGANSNVLSSAEIYNPATGQWTPTGSMAESRFGATATLLPNGRVLVSGGYRSGTSSLSGAELYDPNTGQWTRTGSLRVGRDTHTATLLPNGMVLAAGGLSGDFVESSAELYNPATGEWNAVSGMSTARAQHTATLLLSGKVLVVGGVRDDLRNAANYLRTAELFDPATNTWSQTSAMSTTRARHGTVLLLSGQALTIGGIDSFDNSALALLNSAERYDPGLGFSEETRPVVGRVSLSGGAFTLTGVRFQSPSEGSSGNSQNSVGNYPVVQLRDLESGQVRTLTPGPSGWSNNSFTAQSIGSPPAGFSLLTVISDGVPSPAQPYSPSAANNGTAIPMVNISGRVSTLGNTGFRATMTLTSSTGEVRTTQTNANGEYSFGALPTRPDNATPTPTATPTCSISILPNTSSLPSGTVGTAYSTTISATPVLPFGGYSYSRTAGNLPPGLTLNQLSGVISGTPTITGTSTFTVTATNANECSGSRSYTLTIGSCPTITISPTSFPAGTVGTFYGQTVSVSGGVPPYTFQLASGNFPPGLGLSSIDISILGLFGTPTISGTFSFTLRATAANGCTGTRPYTMTINGGCPTITVNPATGSLPSGTRFLSYSTSLSASPSGSYSFSLVSGTLPLGFTLSPSGFISGVTQQSGTFTIIVRATNANGCFGSRQYNLFISSGGTALIEFTRADDNANAALAPEQQTITYTVTPSATTPSGQQVQFSPASRTYSGLTNDVNNANFLVVGPPVDIDGVVRTNSSSLSGVRVVLSFKNPDDSFTELDSLPMTETNGIFTFVGLAPGNAYRIQPQRTGFTFSFPDFTDQPVLDFPNLTASFAGLQCLGQLAAVAPGVTTNAATNVTTTSATLNGTVNPNGTATQVTFEFATNAAFTNSTPINAQNLPASNNDLPVNVNVSNLIPGTTYFFRIIANNNLVTTTSPAQFTTAPATISGLVRLSYGAPTQPVQPVPGVNLVLTGAANQNLGSGPTGAFSFTGLSGGNYTITPARLRNTTNNGISNADASRVARFIAEDRTGLNASQVLAANADGSAVVSTTDASLIARFNLTPDDPGGNSLVGNWVFPSAPLTFTPLADSLGGQVIEAVLIGDVTGNWNPNAGLLANGEETPSGQNLTTLLNSLLPPILSLPWVPSPSPVNDANPQAVAQAINVSLPALNAQPGASVTIPITVSELTGRGALGYEFNLLFNQNLLQPQATAFDQANTLSNGLTVMTNTTAGRLRVVAFGAAPLSGNGTLLNLRFTAFANASPGANTPLTLTGFLFNEGDPASNVTNGSLMIISPVSVPTVTTIAATNVTTTTATLNGTVNPNGAATQTSFEYATNAAFTNSTTVNAQNLSTGTAAQNVNANITGLTPGTTYFFRARATNSAGPATGSGLSFTTTVCTFAINPTSQTLSSGGGSGSVAVTTAAGCTWTATSNDAWLTINSGTPGNGNGTVNYSVAANTGPQRTGTITAAGQTLTVTQAAPLPPTISLSPASLALAVGGNQSITVNLSAAQSSAVNVTLASSNVAVATVPASVTIPANATSASFSVAGIAVGGPVTITATLPANLGSGNATASVQVSSAVIVRIGAASGSPGSTVAIPIEIVSTGGVNGLGFSINFDPAILSAPQAALGSDATGSSFNINSSQSAQGRLGVTLAMPGNQAFPGGTRQILTVTFTIAAGVTATSSPITFGSQPIPQEVADVAANTLLANFQGGVVTINQGLEADVSPRPNGNGALSLTDWVLAGRFVSGDDTPAVGSEFQRADCAPKSSSGNGLLTISDWVQAGRYSAGLDASMPAAGPTAPVSPFSFTMGTDFVTNLMKQISRPDARTLRLRTETGKPGEAFSLLIELDALGEENALGFSLNFDAVRWQLLSAEPAQGVESAKLLLNRTQLQDGKLGIALALQTGEKLPAGRHLLLSLRFSPLNNRAELSPFTFGDAPITRELVSAEAESLPLNFARDNEQPLTVASAADFNQQRLARESIAVAFGQNLTEATATQVFIVDANGTEHSARVFSASPEQLTFQVPADAALGPANVLIRTATGELLTTAFEIVETAPAIFSAMAENRAFPAATLLRVHSDGRLSYDPVSRLRFGDEEQLILVLFGTGLRHHQGRVSAQIGMIELPVLFAGAQGEFAGLDQINLALPRSLAGNGEVTLKLTVDGQSANPLRLIIN